MVLFLLLLFTIFVSNAESKGVIAVLQKASKTSHLIIRNIHLARMFYREGHVNNFDVVIFCEHLIDMDMQEKLQNSSKLPLKFVFVDEQLRGSEKEYLTKKKEPSAQRQMHKMCPENGGSNYFGFGYKSMCQFWFTDFQKYVKEYDWLLRIDDDCHLMKLNKSLSPSLSYLFPLPENIPFAPAMWYMGEGCKSYKTTVTGLLKFAQQFASAHNLSSSSSSQLGEQPRRNISAYLHDTSEHVSGSDSDSCSDSGK